MKAIVNGLDTHYLSEGKGPVILMLHGWGASLGSFDYLASKFLPNFQVIRFDLPGFGLSQTPQSDWGIDELASFTRSFCDKIAGDPQILVGHSVGGQTAVHLVGSGQLKPKKLILLAASAVRPTPGPRERAYNVVAKLGKTLVRNQRVAARLKTKLYAHAGTTDYLGSGAMQASYRRIITQDQLGYAAKIHIPTLLVWGDQDTDAPLERGKLLAQTIPHSKLEVLAGAGHYMFLDQPEATTGLIKDFMSA